MVPESGSVPSTGGKVLPGTVQNGRLLWTEEVREREFLAASGLFQTRSPPCGGRNGLSWGPSSRAGQVVPDCWSKVRLPGVAGNNSRWGIKSRFAAGSLLGTSDSIWGLLFLFVLLSFCPFRNSPDGGCRPGDAGAANLTRGLVRVSGAPAGPELGAVRRLREAGSWSSSNRHPGPAVSGVVVWLPGPVTRGGSLTHCRPACGLAVVGKRPVSWHVVAGCGAEFYFYVPLGHRPLYIPSLKIIKCNPRW